MSKRVYLVLPLIGICAMMGSPAHAQRAGQSVNVQFGVVRSAEEVVLESDAARGALVGGMLGLVSAGGRSSSRTARNGIIGAGLGGVATGVTEGDRSGMSYTVEMANGSSTTIITDQRDIREGDCVAIEQVRDTANIRRATASYCDRKNQPAVNSVSDHTQSDAVACQAAKQQLVEATAGTDAADLAARKVQLLCNG